jgi:hypothetical protein
LGEALDCYVDQITTLDRTSAAAFAEQVREDLEQMPRVNAGGFVRRRGETLASAVGRRVNLSSTSSPPDAIQHVTSQIRVKRELRL